MRVSRPTMECRLKKKERKEEEKDGSWDKNGKIRSKVN